MSRRLALAAALVVVALVPAAGGTAASGATTAAPFPVTVTVGNGKVTVSKRPARIVSLSPTATETLFAIGAGSQVVAVDDQSDYPKSAPKTGLSGLHAERRGDRRVPARPRRGRGRPEGPGLGADAARDPGAVPQARLDDPAAPTSRSGSSARSPGTAPQAARVVARMKARISAIVAKRKPSAQGLSVYHELDPSFFSATSSTFVGRVYALFGLKNVADAAPGGSDYPQLSPEYIVASNPELSCSPTRSAAARPRRLSPHAPAGRAIKAVREPVDRARRRLGRLALGPAARGLRPRGRHRAAAARELARRDGRAAARRSSCRRPRLRPARFAPAASRPAGRSPRSRSSWSRSSSACSSARSTSRPATPSGRCSRASG